MTTPFAHTFHIPVMGIGFTIDTPAKVAHYGISSAISMVDDILMEKMREFYCKKFDIPFQEISKKIEDFRAKRVTEYLNVIDEVVKRNFEELQNSVFEKREELEKYLDMLPAPAAYKNRLLDLLEENNPKKVWEWMKANLAPGSIDINIMTKLDKENYKDDEPLPAEYRDAHAALRGFAKSKLNSALILSAGINPALYSYLEKFEDFYPDQNGAFPKKIILKVSDYRSAIIQGKFLAKKGLWISEFRLESGLNCGGHAFATEGYLMGPILEEFKTKRTELIKGIHDVFVQGLKSQNRAVPVDVPPVKFTAQGGVGTAGEHQFLLDYYKLDSIGWGSPFLLVPEAVSVDAKTSKLLCDATEKDLYLSNASPLGVPFNNVRGNTKDVQRFKNIDKGRPGSSCPKKYASLNTEFTERVICTASRQYQQLKIQELEDSKPDEATFNKEFEKITEKSCICVGLGTSALLANNLDTKIEGEGVSVCPGPNIAYFTEEVSLKRMADHIYGRDNVISRSDRPFVFVKELSLYVDYFKKKAEELPAAATEKERKYLDSFQKNLNEGINYYKGLFTNPDIKTGYNTLRLIEELGSLQQELNAVETLSRIEA